MEHSLTEIDIVHEVKQAAVLPAVEGNAGHAVHGGSLCVGSLTNLVGYIQLTGLQGNQCGGIIDAGNDFHILDGRLAVPVVGVGGELHGAGIVLSLEDVGAGTDRRLRSPVGIGVIALLLHHIQQLCQEVFILAVIVGQRKDNRLIVHGLTADSPCGHIELQLTVLHDGIEGEHHVAGLDTVAIGEVCLVQMEGNLVAILLPALCQAGDDVAIVVKFRQGIEQGVHHNLVGVAVDQRIEPLRGKNGLDPQRAVCLCREAGCGQCQHHNDSQKH